MDQSGCRHGMSIARILLDRLLFSENPSGKKNKK